MVKTGMRVQDGDRRGTVIATLPNGVVRVAWDGGGTGHRPANVLTVIDPNGAAR